METYLLKIIEGKVVKLLRVNIADIIPTQIIVGKVVKRLRVDIADILVIHTQSHCKFQATTGKHCGYNTFPKSLGGVVKRMRVNIAEMYLLKIIEGKVLNFGG